MENKKKYTINIFRGDYLHKYWACSWIMLLSHTELLPDPVCRGKWNNEWWWLWSFVMPIAGYLLEVSCQWLAGFHPWQMLLGLVLSAEVLWSCFDGQVREAQVYFSLQHTHFSFLCLKSHSWTPSSKGIGGPNAGGLSSLLVDVPFIRRHPQFICPPVFACPFLNLGKHSKSHHHTLKTSACRRNSLNPEQASHWPD